MKNKLLECIDTLTLFGFQITFAPFDSFRFKIELRKGEHINTTILPADHMTEHKIIKYAEKMRLDIEEKINNNKNQDKNGTTKI